MRLTVTALAAITLPVLAGCGSTSTTEPQPQEAVAGDQPAVVAVEDLVIIDVRTPAEFSEQHLDGALNIDLQSGDFVDRISELDRNGTYAVYCRSGNRSAEAVAAMKTLGFVNVGDYGSVAEASEALGITVIS